MAVFVPDLPAHGTRDATRLERELRFGDCAAVVRKLAPSALLRDVSRHLDAQVAAEKAGYQKRQAAIARANARVERRDVPGLGRLVADIDARTFFRWQQHDAGFWLDKNNVRKFLRDNPECAVAHAQQCRVKGWR